MKITIPGNAISKKNSQRVILMGKRRSIRPSEAYDKWDKQACLHLRLMGIQPWKGSYPVDIQFFFYRQNRRKFDIDNLFCGALDVLQKVGFLEDDSMSHVIPVYGGWEIDKEHPRVELFISERIV